MIRLKYTTIFSIALFVSCGPALAAGVGCEGYPLTDGLSVKETERGPKIMSTATVSVAMDDAEEVVDATKEAEMTAKAEISKFFSETIKSEQSIEKAVETQIKIIGERKDATKNTLKKTLTTLQNSSEALLKGVQKIGDCYTQGKYVMVTVGMKPESIAAAVNGKALVEGTADNIEETPSGANGLSNVESYSNTKGLQDY